MVIIDCGVLTSNVHARKQGDEKNVKGCIRILTMIGCLGQVREILWIWRRNGIAVLEVAETLEEDDTRRACFDHPDIPATPTDERKRHWKTPIMSCTRGLILRA